MSLLNYIKHTFIVHLLNMAYVSSVTCLPYDMKFQKNFSSSWRNLRVKTTLMAEVKLLSTMTSLGHAWNVQILEAHTMLLVMP